MSFFQVTSSELKHRAEELRNLNQRFANEEEALSNYHNALNSMWEGETKEAFSREFIQDRAKMDLFKNAINQYIEALLVIASRYDEAESRNIAVAGARSV